MDFLQNSLVTRKLANSLPLIPNIHSQISQLCHTSKEFQIKFLNSVGVKVALKPLPTFLLFKDSIITSEKSCLTYKTPCNNCEFSYIGQTKRDLKFQNFGTIRNQQPPEKLALCEHLMINHHKIAWQVAQILKTKLDYSKWLFAESWFINKKSNVLNRNDGVAFPSTNTKSLNY